MRRELLILVVITAVGAEAAFAQSGGYTFVNFFDLANFTYNAKEPLETTPHVVSPSGVPARLWSLSGQKISVIGVAVPITWDKDGSDEFMLAVSQDVCGFGGPPRINEWIYVKMNGGKKVMLHQGTEYRVKGLFHIKETVEDGRVTMLYSFNADIVE